MLFACGSSESDSSDGGNQKQEQPPPDARPVFGLAMHFHRLFNGMGSTPPSFKYSLARDWDIQGIHLWEIWKSDGSLDFSLVDQVYSGHAGNGAKMIRVISGTPTWAARNPTEADPQYNVLGRRSGPEDLDAYEDMIFRFITHNKQYLWGVEGENEPFGCTTADKQFFSGSPTLLADMQKRLYLATKRVDENIVVISPAQSYTCGIQSLLAEAKTSQGEPISNFFDIFGFHLYNNSANVVGPIGRSYESSIDEIKTWLTAVGLSQMKMADTEHGWGNWEPSGAQFLALSDDDKAKVIYETTRVAKDKGLVMLGWFSYESDFIGTPMSNAKVSQGIENAFVDFASFGFGK